MNWPDDGFRWFASGYSSPDKICEVITVEQLYRVLLPDTFAPSFCTFFKPYYGTKKAIATVLGSAELHSSNEPEPVQALGSQQVNMAKLTDTFKNLWDYDYYLKADEVKATLIYILDKDRCVKVSMRNITCTAELIPGQTLPIDAGECWGLLIFVQMGVWMASLLYYRERTFDTKEDLRLDMANPTPIDFNGYWQDIFADG